MAFCLKFYAQKYGFLSGVLYRNMAFLSDVLYTDIRLYVWNHIYRNMAFCLIFHTPKYGFCLKFYIQKYGFLSEVPYIEIWLCVWSSIYRNMAFCLKFYTWEKSILTTNHLISQAHLYFIWCRNENYSEPHWPISKYLAAKIDKK